MFLPLLINKPELFNIVHAKNVSNLDWIEWMMPSTVEEVSHSWAFRRRKRRPSMGCCPISLLLEFYGKRNMKAFEGVDIDIIKLQNSLLFLVSFWCTQHHKVSLCIDE